MCFGGRRAQWLREKLGTKWPVQPGLVLSLLCALVSLNVTWAGNDAGLVVEAVTCPAHKSLTITALPATSAGPPLPGHTWRTVTPWLGWEPRKNDVVGC